MSNKNNFFIDLTLVLFLVVAAVLVYQNRPTSTAGGKVPPPVVNNPGAAKVDTKVLKPADLPQDIPKEFAVDPQAVLVADETKDGRTSVIYQSKLAPADLMAKFLENVKAAGWTVGSQNKDATSAQVFASKQNQTYLRSTVDFRANLLQNKITEIYIKYQR